MREKAIIVGLQLKKSQDFDFASSMDELEGLAEAAGAEVIARLLQNRDRPEASTYIGKGKIEELSRLIEEMEPDLIIFDSELSPVQLRNLEQCLDIKIIDRTILILDIFSQRARSREGKLQVELASLQYRLPRLTGKGIEMSRTGAGIGTRGAGEQKLELDRRRIRRHIQDIKVQMQKLEKTRKVQKMQRKKAGLKTVSMVGYTNAGKSSLFNYLCKVSHRSGNEQVSADNRLFQTLDTTIRKIKLPSKQEILISDTVGFIQNLPHHLVAAFHSTLEEAVEADLLLHVVDVSDPAYLEKIQVVEKVLENLGAEADKILNVFNKTDLLELEPAAGKESIYLSARTGDRIDELLSRIEEKLFI